MSHARNKARPTLHSVQPNQRMQPAAVNVVASWGTDAPRLMRGR